MEASNDDDLSFDITKCFPEHVCDNIFGNLENRDLLKASLVSTEWYKSIAKSAVCMQKLKLTFSREDLEETRHVEGILMDSDRKYENVEFNKVKSQVKSIDMRNILQIRGRKWKKVTITQQCFPSFLDFIDFIAIFEPFVEELKMKDVHLLCDPINRKLSEQQKKSFTFPNMKCLKVTIVEASMIEVFQGVVTLTEFSIRTYGDRRRLNPKAITAILKMIYYNKGLQKLSTSGIVFKQMICGKISSVKLISLQVCHSCRYYLSEVTMALIKTNFKQFLELNLNTLETLSLDDWMGLDATKVIFQMRKLKHLSLGGLYLEEETVDWKETSFKQSLSLTSLDLHDFEFNVDILRAFIIATPNVKKLELPFIDDENIACISELLPSLESLSVDWFKVSDVTDKPYLPKLKEFSMHRYNKRIKESGAEEDRSQFESLFLDKKNTAYLYD